MRIGYGCIAGGSGWKVKVLLGGAWDCCDWERESFSDACSLERDLFGGVCGWGVIPVNVSEADRGV